MKKTDKVLIVLYSIGGLCALMSIIFTLLAGEVSVMSHCLADASIIVLILNLILNKIYDSLLRRNQEESKDGSPKNP